MTVEDVIKTIELQSDLLKVQRKQLIDQGWETPSCDENLERNEIILDALRKRETVAALETILTQKMREVEDILRKLSKNTPCSLCGYGGEHLASPPCTGCPAHPKGKEVVL